MLPIGGMTAKLVIDRASYPRRQGGPIATNSQGDAQSSLAMEREGPVERIADVVDLTAICRKPLAERLRLGFKSRSFEDAAIVFRVTAGSSLEFDALGELPKSICARGIQ